MNLSVRTLLRGFEAVPELLRRGEVDTVFGLLGGSNAAWVAHGVATGNHRFIRTRHEETAVTAAAGYSRATGRLGVCTTTKGPPIHRSCSSIAPASRSARRAWSRSPCRSPIATSLAGAGRVSGAASGVTTGFGGGADAASRSSVSRAAVRPHA